MMNKKEHTLATPTFDNFRKASINNITGNRLNPLWSKVTDSSWTVELTFNMEIDIVIWIKLPSSEGILKHQIVKTFKLA